MKAPETQTSKSKTSPKYHLFTPLLLAAMTSSALAGNFADRIRSETGMIINQPQEAMISAMPAPRLSGDEANGSCLNTPLTFANQAAQSGMHSRYGLPLRLWAMAHTGARAESGQCIDMAFATKLWQSAIGSPITGQLSERDVAELVRVVDSSNPEYVQARRNDTMTPQQRQVDMFMGLAQQGDTKAQYRVAFVYEGQKNYTEAVKWYRKAADQGLPQAQEKLEQMYKQGLGVDKNENEGRDSAEGGSVKSYAKANTAAEDKRLSEADQKIMSDSSLGTIEERKKFLKKLYAAAYNANANNAPRVKSYCEMSATERVAYIDEIGHQTLEQYSALSKKERINEGEFIQDANLDKALTAAGDIKYLENRIMKDSTLGTVKHRKAMMKRAENVYLCKKR